MERGRQKVLAPYPLALLQLMREGVSAENLHLGMATRVRVENSAFSIPAYRLLTFEVAYIMLTS